MNNHHVKIWDLPIRLFHWSLLMTIILAYLAIKTELLATEWHWYTGACMTFLWFFRICWGFLGTSTARFSQFFPTPKRLIHYSRHPWRGIGHTPTGGLSVIAMLLLLAAMLATGLFASDDITLQGPLASYVDEAWNDRMSHWHVLLFNVLLGLIVLHVLAIFGYWIFKQDNLLSPMIHGRKTVSLATSLALAPAQSTTSAWRLFCSVLIAAALTWLLFSTWAHTLFSPPPPVVTPASQHAW